MKTDHNTVNAKKIGDAWEASKGPVAIPGTGRAVVMSKVEVEGPKVSVWVSEDTSGSPDFVIVNGPIEVANSNGIIVEDPLTALATVIDGATK